MARFVLSIAAQEDIQNIKDYIARDNTGAARRVVGELRDAIRGLVEMPGKGHMREDLTDEEVLFWPVYGYLIVYRSRGDVLEVLHIVGGWQDVEALLKRRPSE